MPKSIVSPEEQTVTFVELFFDLVFVFSVTQVVGLLHEGLALPVVGRAILVFWLIWWAWTQFTWALNAADTTHAIVEVGTLLATAVAFFMAVAVPDAFHGRELWFAATYVLVRVIGLAIYVLVAAANPRQRSAVRTFATVSVGGLVAVLIGGWLGGSWQLWFWGLAIVLDIIAALIGGRVEGWDLHPHHFAERHGLFVIIALGESLIVAASGVTGVQWNSTVLAVAILAVAITCGLWWSYFTHMKPELDRSLVAALKAGRAGLARDVYSLFHFPMLCGVIAYAVAAEEVLAHPDAALSVEVRAALAVSLLLFVGGMVLAMWRANGRLLWARLLLTVAGALVILFLSGLAPLVSLAVALATLLVILLLEERMGLVAGEEI